MGVSIYSASEGGRPCHGTCQGHVALLQIGPGDGEPAKRIGDDGGRAVLRAGLGQSVDVVLDALQQVAPAASNAALKRAGAREYRDLKHFVADRPGHDRRYAVDASKTRRELGWAPARSFRDGLQDTVAWYVENRDNLQEKSVGYDRQRLGLGTAAAR